MVHLLIHVDNRPGAHRAVFSGHLDHSHSRHDVIDLIFGMRDLGIGGPGPQDVQADTQTFGPEKLVIQFPVPPVAVHDLGHVECVNHFPPLVGVG